MALNKTERLKKDKINLFFESFIKRKFLQSAMTLNMHMRDFYLLHQLIVKI